MTMSFFEALGNVLDVIRRVMTEDFEVVREGRTFQVHVLGHIHETEVWVYDVTATDIRTKVSETLDDCNHKEDGVERAIQAVLRALRDTEPQTMLDAGETGGTGLELPAEILSMLATAQGYSSGIGTTANQLMEVLGKKGFIPAPPPPPPPQQQKQEEQQQLVQRQQQTVAPVCKPSQSSAGGVVAIRTEIEPDLDGLYTSTMVSPAKPEPFQLDPTTTYDTWSSSHKGLAYILNNHDFPYFVGNAKQRRGSEVDVQNVQHLFSQLGYYPVVHENLTRNQILSSIDKIVNKINDEGDRHSSVCFIFMSHGNENGVCGTDATEVDQRIVTRDEIKARLTGRRCKALLGKPKMIFIQACRGNEFTRNADELDTASPATQRDYIQFETDYIPTARPPPSISLQLDSATDDIDDELDGSAELQNNAEIFVANATSNDESTCDADEFDAASPATEHDDILFEMDCIPAPRPLPSISLQLDSATGDSDYDLDGGAELPDNADIFVANATSNGYYSIRMRRDGSWFIQALSEVFLAHAHEDDLNELMRKVTCLVTERYRTKHRLQQMSRPFEVRQTPAYESQGMRKRFYFHPKYPPSDKEVML